MDEIRLRGESKELKDEVVELARKYSIVTPYTAYLITEDETRRGVSQNLRTLHFENEAGRRHAKVEYDFFMKDKSGEKAVASARSYSQLKSANAPADAIAAGNVDAFLAATPSAPALQLGRQSVSQPAGTAVGKPALAEVAAQQYAQQSRFVAGKTFFQNQSQWIDADAQKFANAQKVRVQFGSTEYFDLQKKHPKAQSWLSVGNNVQFVLDGTVYEIYE